MTTGNYLHTQAMTGLQRRRRRRKWVTAILAALMLLLAAAMLLYGNTIYSPSVVWRVLMGEEIKGAAFAIRTIRLPRMAAAVLSGLSFGMSGYVFQTILRNPLASPDIIGVTSGASVMAVFCILVLGMGNAGVSVLSVLAGIAAAALIYGLACMGGFSQGRMILIGIGMQALLRAAITYLLSRAAQYDVAGTLQWLNGSLNNAQLGRLPWLFGAAAVFGIVLLGMNRHLEAAQLGNEYASTLGLNVRKDYMALFLCAVCLAAFATSVTGPIASVAFLSGPIANRLAGHGRSNLVQAGLTGAVLVLAADMIGQYAFAARYPVGVVTGILGAPYLLFLLVQMNKKGEGI